VKSFKDTGWDHPVKYFLSINSTTTTGTEVATANVSDGAVLLSSLLSLPSFSAIQRLQQAVLQDHYIEPSKTLRKFHYSADNLVVVVQVLVLDRQMSFRDFVFAGEIVGALHDFVYTTTNSNNKRITYQVNVTYVQSFNEYSFHQQALAVHLADIIFSPHGAQLANLVYVRPCTAVVEFFPREYYVQFFTPLVVNAYGISFEAYPSAGNKFVETQAMSQAVPGRTGVVRSISIDITPRFFPQTISELIDATAQCHSKVII
jgi:hypothetical protein